MQLQRAHINESCHTNDLSDKSYLYEAYLCHLPGETGPKKPKDLAGAGARNLTDALAAATRSAGGVG
jgi:hypothetical protein